LLEGRMDAGGRVQMVYSCRFGGDVRDGKTFCVDTRIPDALAMEEFSSSGFIEVRAYSMFARCTVTDSSAQHLVKFCVFFIITPSYLCG